MEQCIRAPPPRFISQRVRAHRDNRTVEDALLRQGCMARKSPKSGEPAGPSSTTTTVPSRSIHRQAASPPTFSWNPLRLFWEFPAPVERINFKSGDGCGSRRRLFSLESHGGTVQRGHTTLRCRRRDLVLCLFCEIGAKGRRHGRDDAEDVLVHGLSFRRGAGAPSMPWRHRSVRYPAN